ncbi:hypothetical protein SAMN04487995_1070 [Dyadobacter koreensis]|uniref:Uncharacterized protein n=1 Tax=Dyadobacter koreensis TaxID=408657 RepID=A0A1H6RAL8_9BACT|nr:hypothetical protein SAMN04487995_1070 [Dyadobacter koreensis]
MRLNLFVSSLLTIYYPSDGEKNRRTGGLEKYLNLSDPVGRLFRRPTGKKLHN